MAKGPGPEQMADYFFKQLMHNQCHLCWTTFSEYSRQYAIRWTMEDIYQRHPNAARGAQLAAPEIKMLFDNNDTSIMKTFWKRFFFSSGANDFFHFGTYETVENDGKKATVRINLGYPNGHRAHVDVAMLNERGGWKLAYFEAELPF